MLMTDGHKLIKQGPGLMMTDLDMSGTDVPLTPGVGPSTQTVPALRPRHHLGLCLLEAGAQSPRMLRDPPAHQACVTSGLSRL